MSDADLKAEMRKAVLELQFLTTELNSALARATAKIEANEVVASDLRDLYGRANARSEHILDELDRLQNSVSTLTSR